MTATQDAAFVRNYEVDGDAAGDVCCALIYPGGAAVKLNNTEDVNSAVIAHISVYSLPVTNSANSATNTRYGAQLSNAQWQWFWLMYPGPMTGFVDSDFPAGRRPIVNGVPKGQ